MSALDAVLAKLNEIGESIKKADAATNVDALKALFAEEAAKLATLQAEQKIADAPDRRVPGALIGPDGEPLQKSNRYHRMLKDFDRDGYSRVGGTKVKAVDLWLTHLIMTHGHQAIPEQVKAPSEDLKAAIKAMTSDGTGTGAELIPTELADQLWNDFFLASRVAGLFQQIAMPAATFELPLGFDRPTFRKGRQNQATSHTNHTTAKIQLISTELVSEQVWSYTLDEDSIIALMPAFRVLLAEAGSETIDAFILNADNTNAATGNINSDDADPVDDSYYLTDGQDGIRHQWLVDNTAMTVNAAAAALADSHITGAMAKMGKYAANPQGLVMVTDIQTYLNGFLKLDNVTTVEKFGAGAVVLTGQLASYRGIPIVVSASHGLAEADGKQSATAASNTLGSISLVNHSQWLAGFRRKLLIEIDRDVRARSYIMVTSMRQAVATRGTRSTNTHTAGIRNILVA